MMPPAVPIAAQLYVFGEQTQGVPGLTPILAGLAEAGYNGIEGIGGEPSDLAPLSAAGLAFVGPHVVLPALSDPEAVAIEVKRLGGEAVICSGLRHWDVRDAAAYREAAGMLNDAGHHLRSQDLRLHYHNHDFEFERVEGMATGMDLLCEGLDPEAVELCVDVGWVWRAGLDPASFLLNHRMRIGSIHLRDFAGTRSVPLGRGEIDLAPVVALLPELPHLRWAIVEQDPDSRDPLADMQASREYLGSRFRL